MTYYPLSLYSFCLFEFWLLSFNWILLFYQFIHRHESEMTVINGSEKYNQMVLFNHIYDHSLPRFKFKRQIYRVFSVQFKEKVLSMYACCFFVKQVYYDLKTNRWCKRLCPMWHCLITFWESGHLDLLVCLAQDNLSDHCITRMHHCAWV